MWRLTYCAAKLPATDSSLGRIQTEESDEKLGPLREKAGRT